MTDFYVCNETGDDSNIGLESQPLKTIHRASTLANTGSTIYVLPGIYRERIIPQKSGIRNKPITYKSVEKHGAIIRGSIPWKYTETTHIGVKGPLDLSVFSDNSHKDGANPFQIPLCVTPFGREGAPESKIKPVKDSDPNMVYCLGQVFVDDLMYKQCPYKSEMEATDKSWYYDSSDNILHIHGATSEQNIEITNQRRLLAPHKRGLKNIVVDGFTFERCGNQYPNKFWARPSNQQAGALGTRCGKFWTIQNNVISWANGIGIDWGNEGRYKSDLESGFNGNASGSYGNKILNNIICDNGAAGTAAFMANRFEFVGNKVERNNNMGFKGKQRWESAGVKIHHPKNSIISNNMICNNHCHGIWSDQGAGINTFFQNNVITNNEGNGVEFEIGRETTGKVVNNIFDDNECGVRFSASGGALIAHNTFVKSRVADIKTLIYKRDKDKWDSLNVEIYYNLFMNSPQFIQLSPPNDTPNMLASRFLDYNTYVMEPGQKKFQMKFSWKHKINADFSTWKSILGECADTNNTDGCIGCDENSAFLSDPVPVYPVLIEKMGCVKDYKGECWPTDKCIAGAFVTHIPYYS